MKKLFILLGLGVLSLSGCDLNNPTPNNANKASFKDMYSLSALSGINMLNMGTAPSLKKKAANLTDEEKTERENIEEATKVIEDSKKEEKAEDDIIEETEKTDKEEKVEVE